MREIVDKRNEDKEMQNVEVRRKFGRKANEGEENFLVCFWYRNLESTSFNEHFCNELN